MASNVALPSAVLLALCLHEGAATQLQRSQQRGIPVEPGFKAGPRTEEAQLWDLGAWKQEEASPYQCGVRFAVTSASEKYAKCPSGCPLIVQDKLDEHFCTFHCVEAHQCSDYNAQAPIGDSKHGVCRSPLVQACSDYYLDGTDRCRKCNTMYLLGEDGQCYYEFMYLLYVLGAILLVLAIVGILWAGDMLMRPSRNDEGLTLGFEYRSRQKLHQPKDINMQRSLWPLSTSLLRTPVAGPGVLLHFNFQLNVIIWAAVVGCIWIGFGLFVDRDLFILGTRRFGTPLHNCIVIKWGAETAHRLEWAKIYFLVIVYIFSFGGAMFHSVRQLRLFQELDFQHKTMKDFAAEIVGLGGVRGLNGSVRLEEELKEAIQGATGQEVIGVSPAWDYKKQREDVERLIKRDLDAYEANYRGDEAQVVEGEAEQAPEPPAYRKRLLEIERRLLVGADRRDEALASDENVVALLQSFRVSNEGFVVFETEAMRDAAVKWAKAHAGIEYRGARIWLSAAECEPETIQWWNFGHTSVRAQLLRGLVGFACILAALTVWTVVFFLPYAWSILNFNYDNGQEPPVAYAIAFTLVVVIGNAMMYEVCARVADYIGLRFTDDKAAVYMILYTVACLFNVVLDFVTTFWMSRQIMIELGFRTYGGVKLEDLKTFTDIFESYPMQRSLAENVFRYAFPSTYLIPFLVEPLTTIYLPLKLGVLVVKSHPEIRGRAAEDWVACIPLQLGRYADLLLNMFLGILIFYFPGGWTHRLFFGMAGSHIWIYLMDHCKVLRSIPACNFANITIDWWSQLMLAPCCALILSSLVFKANCRDYGHCLKGMPMIAACTGAFLLHSVVHVLLLICVVPRFGKEPPPQGENEKTYRDVSQRFACSFFSSNPLQCLRSKYIYNHERPCVYCTPGKEHLLVVNEELGLHFHDKAAEVEDYSSQVTGWGMVRVVIKAMEAFKEAGANPAQGRPASSADVDDEPGDSSGGESSRTVAGAYGAQERQPAGA